MKHPFLSQSRVSLNFQIWTFNLMGPGQLFRKTIFFVQVLSLRLEACQPFCWPPISTRIATIANCSMCCQAGVCTFQSLSLHGISTRPVVSAKGLQRVATRNMKLENMPLHSSYFSQIPQQRLEACQPFCWPPI